MHLFLYFLCFNVCNPDSSFPQLFDVLVEILAEESLGIIVGSHREVDVVLVMPLLHHLIGFILHRVSIRIQTDIFTFASLEYYCCLI